MKWNCVPERIEIYLWTHWKIGCPENKESLRSQLLFNSRCTIYVVFYIDDNVVLQVLFWIKRFIRLLMLSF